MEENKGENTFLKYGNVDDLLKDSSAKQKNLSEVKAVRSTTPGYKPLSWRPVSGQGISLAEYSVPVESIFERQNNGSYVARFENYKGATGNEDRLAKQQTFGEQAIYGFTKNALKVGTYALDATVGTLYGVFNGLNEGRLSAVWDNEFSKNIDDINKRLDYKLPNYYSDEEKSKSVLGSMLTTNFWFNDVAGGFAFVGGAILPELAIAALTGGASASTSLAKLGFKSTAKALAKEAAEQAGKQTLMQSSRIGRLLTNTASKTGFSEGRQVLRGINRAMVGDRAGKVLDTAAFLIRTSNFEAGMEARHNFHESVDNYMRDFADINGRNPSSEELTKFINKAKDGANTVYAANMAILSVSNAAMFGKTFDIKSLPFNGKIARTLNSGIESVRTARRTTENFFNKAIGLGVDIAEDGTRTLQKANKLQRTIGKTYKILEKPLTEGVFEEGLQGVAGKAMQKSMESMYDLDNNHAETMWSSLSEAFSEQYGSNEGLKEILIGGIIGFAGGAFQGSNWRNKTIFSGLGGNSYSSLREQKQKDLTTANEGLADLRKSFADVSAPQGVTVLRAMTKASNASTSRNNDTAPGFDNMNVNLNFIQSQEHIKTQSEIQEDFEMVVDSMEVSKEEQEELGKQGFTVESYKQSMIDDFAKTSKDYLGAKAVVEALRVPDGISDGNLMNLKDAMIRNIVIGKQAQTYAREIGESIENATGVNGLFDALEYYNNLSQEATSAVSELKDVRLEKEDLFQAIVDIQAQIATNNTSKTEGDNKGLADKSKELQMKYVIANQRVQELEKKEANLKKAIESKGAIKDTLKDFEDNQGLGTINSNNITEVISKLDNLDEYIGTLEETGRTQEAAAIKASILEYKAYANTHREFMNMHRRMADTNFFQGEEGRGYLAKIFGKPYQMDPTFYDELKKNDEIVDKALKLSGIDSYEVASEFIKDALEKNPDLSDREKYRIEQMVRIQLQGILMQQTVDDLTSLSNTIEAVQEKPTDNILEGDSITLRTAVNLKIDDDTSLELINSAIKAITEQIDFIQNSVMDKSKLQELENQLELLKKAKENPRPTTTTSPTPQQTTSSGQAEPISDQDYQNFIDNNTVSPQTISSISNKVKNRQPLSPREQAIFTSKTKEINDEIVNTIQEEPKTLKDLTNSLQEKLKQVKNDISKISDLENYLSTFIEEATNGVGKNITDLQEYLKTLNDVFKSKSKQRTKKGQSAQQKQEEARRDLKEKIAFANNLITRLKEAQQNKEQLLQVAQDLQNQINYYNQNISENTTTEDVQNRINKLQGKRDTLTKLIESFEGVISTLKEALSSIIDFVFLKERSYVSYMSFAGLNYNSIEDLKNAVEKGEASSEYGKVSDDLRGIETEMNSLIDQAEEKDLQLQIKQQEKLKLEAEITRVDNKIRYLTELQDFLQQNQINNATQNNQQQKQENTEQGSTSQYQGTPSGQQEKGQGTRSEGETSQPETDNSYSNLTSEEIDAEIVRIEEEIAKEKKNIRIVDSEEYIRLNELAKKEQESGLTDAEQKEYQQLKNDIDQWLLVGGIVTQGITLSDLIRQKVTLENAKVLKPDVIQQRTDKDDIENIDFKPGGKGYNTQFGYTYDAATVRYDKESNSLVVNGIKADDQTVSELFVEVLEDGTTVPIDFEYSFDELGNIVIPIGENNENIDKVNSPLSTISIRPTNKDLRSNYSVVITHRKNMVGENITQPLKSVFEQDFNQVQDTQAIYEAQEGTELVLKVDTRDEYNQDLIQKYKEAKGKKAKAEAKENLRTKLRITASIKEEANDKSSSFVLTLRGKQMDNDKKNAQDIQFELFRDSIVNDKDMFDKLMDETPALHVVEHSKITVKKVWIGQPNLLFSAKDSEGNVTIEFVQFNDQTASKVLDIGFRTSTGYETRNGETGLDTTFMKKSKPTGSTREPFVVLQVGNKKFAYPVRLLPREKRDNKDFEDVFNSDLNAADKVVRLNQILAERGIDIKKAGEFFYAIGNANNLTSEFYTKKIEQLESFDYFYPLDEWLNTKIPMTDILKQQAQINIDVNSPIHSPKIEMDLKEALKDFKVEIPIDQEDVDDKEAEAVVVSKSATVNKYKTKYTNQAAKDAKDETEKPCD